MKEGIVLPYHNSKRDAPVFISSFFKLVRALVCPFVITLFLFPVDAAGLEKNKSKRSKKAKTEQAGKAESMIEGETPDQAKAREHYANGKRLYDEGKFDEALKEFEAAFEIKAHPAVLKSIAECQVQVGNHSAALDMFQKYVDNPESTDKNSVQARIQALKKMAVKVSITSHPAGARISVAGTEFAEVSPADIELAAGEHLITLFVDGYPPVTRGVTVKLSGPNEMFVDFSAEAGMAQPKDALADPFDDGEEETTANESEVEKRLPPAFWICVAATGVGLASGTALGVLALGDEKDYESAPTQAKLDRGERKAIIADVSFGFAGVAAIMGTVIWLTNRKKEKKENATSNIRVLPTTGRHGAGVGAAFSF